MITFLYGKEEFELSNKLHELTSEFLKSSQNGSSFELVDFSEDNAQNFGSLLNSQGLFSAKKMIVVKNVFSDTQAEQQRKIKEILSKVDTKDDIIIYENSEPRKNSVLFKWLISQSEKVYKYDELDGYQLKKWITQKVDLLDTSISHQALEFLILSVGNNLFKLFSEIEKLVNYVSGREIQKEDVEILVHAEVNASIFETVEDLVSRDRTKALLSFKKQIASGDNPNKIHAMYVYQIRTLIMVLGEHERGIRNNLDIAKSTKLHPFVVKKALSVLGSVDKERLFRAHNQLLEIYRKAKVGQFDTETALEMFVLGF